MKNSALGVLLLVLVFLTPVSPACAESTVSLTLKKGTATVASVQLAKGKKYQLPALANTATATFQGWSTAKGLSKKPMGEALQYIVMSRDYALYAVYYKRASEEDIPPKEITAARKSKYQEILFVGDSRFVRTRKAITEAVARSKGFLFYAVSSRSLSGFLEAGGAYNEEALLTQVAKDNDPEKPIAIVFNLGVNDLKSASVDGRSVAQWYLLYLDTLREKLKAYNVKLFYLSVGPVAGTTSQTRGRSLAVIRTFNKAMRSGCGEVGWDFIDSYHWMMAKGFNSLSKTDGLHYSEQTSKRVLDYVVRQVNAW